MVQNTDHRHAIEESVYKWEAIYICRNIEIFIRGSQPLLRLFQLGARIIKQDNALKATVARSISSGTSPKFKHKAPAGREQAFQGNGFCTVFVLASAFIPEGGLVIGAFIITNGRSIFCIHKKRVG